MCNTLYVRLILSSDIYYIQKRGKKMRASKKEYEDVAKRCSAYKRTDCSELSNCVSCDCTSCLNCEHFAPDEHCVLDLYDTIAQAIK